jgi:hypothetical protein
VPWTFYVFGCVFEFSLRGLISREDSRQTKSKFLVRTHVVQTKTVGDFPVSNYKATHRRKELDGKGMDEIYLHFKYFQLKRKQVHK